MTKARSVRPALMILAVYFLSTWVGAAAVQAQGPVPDITLSCQQPQPIEVYPGATRVTIIDCTLENPTIHQEKVNVQIQSGSLAAAGPASMTVGAQSDVSFQVVARAELRMPEGSQIISITAEVVQADGITWVGTPTTYKVLAVIRQFSRLRVASEVAFRSDRLLGGQTSINGRRFGYACGSSLASGYLNPMLTKRISKRSSYSISNILCHLSGYLNIRLGGRSCGIWL